MTPEECRIINEIEFHFNVIERKLSELSRFCNEELDKDRLLSTLKYINLAKREIHEIKKEKSYV